MTETELPQKKKTSDPQPASDNSSKDSASPDNFTVNQDSEKPPAWVLIVSVASGLAFLVILLALAVFIPQPTPFQIFVFRVVLSLAAAAFGATISGFLTIRLPFGKRGLIAATGALALCVMVYQINPPALMSEKVQPSPELKQALGGVIFDHNGTPLPGVLVKIEGTEKVATTDATGGFAFEILGTKQASVRLMAVKEGFTTHRQDVTLGNTTLNFIMQRTP
ncbi:carboxypeptidase regulatory-like domain-containing protein [Desulfococcaceae bacterium HSG7]|nr:carboxypeptidase regulatory-like domain-containing protein [Desulfococcaceae bacterium HSG7]